MTDEIAQRKEWLKDEISQTQAEIRRLRERQQILEDKLESLREHSEGEQI